MTVEVLKARQNKILLDAGALLDAAQKDGRTLNDTETKAYDDLLKEVESVGKSIVKIKGDDFVLAEIENMVAGAVDQTIDRRVARKSFGQEVTDHKAFKDVVELAKRSRRFESDIIELKAAPVLVDGLAPAESLGRIAPGPTQRLTVAALFAQGQTSSNAVTYNRETGFTIAAGAVAEGTAKPESELVLAPIVEPVRKYAHWLTLSKEALDDVAGLRSYIDSRLRYGLALKIDDALLNGTTVAPSLVGILHRPGLGATVTQDTGESVADAILRQAAALQTATGLAADGIVINPVDWMAVLAGKDLQGQYYGNGPFASPAPNGPTLWNIPVAVSTSIAAGTVLVGSFQGGAQLLWRETMAVSVSNSHNDYFTRNLLAILIEARLAMIVTMPEAFGPVTLAAVVP